MGNNIKNADFDVTFLMPAFNVADFIEMSVESIRNQTLSSWNLIIVDDGSTDNTYSIARALSLEDDRISVFKMQKGSGSAYLPRKAAINAANTEFVAPLDADDYISPDYLEKLLGKQQLTGADIVYPTMYHARGNEVKLTTPTDTSLFQNARKGKDCVALTLDGWKINCNGGLIRRNLYLKVFPALEKFPVHTYSDEFLTRHLLLNTPLVAFSDAIYFYRVNEDSVTCKKTPKMFDYLKNNINLIDFALQNFGHDSEEYVLAQRQNFHGIFDTMRLLNQGGFDENAKKYAFSMMEKARAKADRSVIKNNVSKKYLALLDCGLPVARLMTRWADSLMRKRS